jgi:hypothetical protein
MLAGGPDPPTLASACAGDRTCPSHTLAPACARGLEDDVGGDAPPARPRRPDGRVLATHARRKINAFFKRQETDPDSNRFLFLP